MKKHLVPLLCLSLTFMFACSEDEDPVETTTTTSGGNNAGGGNSGGGSTTPEHCSNGVFDHHLGEHDTDCGGACDECTSLSAPCTNEENILLFERILDHPLNEGSTSYYTSAQSADDVFVITASDGAVFGMTGITITCFGQLPETSRRYKVSDISNRVEEGEAYGHYFTPAANNLFASGEDIWLIKDGNQWRVVFCDVKVNKNNATSALDVLNANIPFDPS